MRDVIANCWVNGLMVMMNDGVECYHYVAYSLHFVPSQMYSFIQQTIDIFTQSKARKNLLTSISTLIVI
jgi:hypothetical protein